MDFTRTKTLYNVKLTNDGKIVFDKDFFWAGRELVTMQFKTVHSEPRMCTVVSCTDTLLTIELAGDFKRAEITVDAYIKDIAFWAMHKDNVTKEDILKTLERNNSKSRRVLDSESLIRFAALGERYEIKSENMFKFTPYVTEKPFIFVDNDDNAYTLSVGVSDNELGIGIIPMEYSESPDDYSIVGDFDEIEVFDRTRGINANDFINKFKRLAVFNAKTMSVEEDDLNKCVIPCEGYDNELMRKIPAAAVVAYKCDSSIHDVLGISSLMWHCADKTLVSEIDYVRAAEYTSVPVTLENIFNTID